MAKKKDRIISAVSVSDVQEVAEEWIDRELTPEELKLVEDRMDNYLAYTSWHDAICLAIDEMIYHQRKSDTEDK